MIQDNNLMADFNSLPPDEQAKVIDFIKRLKDKQNEAKKEPSKRQFGCVKGLVKYMADDFDAPLEDFAEYMY